ncbi:MAG: hypothetical protein OXN44_06210 [Acidimicrobiaceae bacterium]|nr:hypothetical protein [Acidimicrobiaceae bacterium]
MQIQRYEEIDISEWQVSGEEDLGTKPKRWLINPETEERWLMKDATFSHASDGTTYRKGDDWAERVAHGVAETLRLPAARVEIAVDQRGPKPVCGTVCRTVLRDGESLVNGDELMGECGITVSHHHRESYTTEAAFQALCDVEPPLDVAAGLSAWVVFIGYLVLDALIGNTDRHEENWCVISSVEAGSQRRLSPTFDHASSLGFLLSDQDRQERLSSKDSNRTPEAYADRAKTPFASKPHPIEVVDNAEQLSGRGAAEYWLGQVEHVDDLLIPIWAIPEHRMSTPAREFAERVLRHNWSKMTA